MRAADPEIDRWRNEMSKGALADVIARIGPRIGVCHPHPAGREQPESGQPSGGTCT